MAIKYYNVAVGVRVKLNENFEEKCLGDKYLREQEDTYFINSEKPFNDELGEYVFITGGSHTTSGRVYLNEIDLEFPYDISDKIENDKDTAKKFRQDQPENHSTVFILTKSGEIEKCYYNDGYFEMGKTGMNWMTLRDIYGWVYQKDLLKFINETNEKMI